MVIRLINDDVLQALQFGFIYKTNRYDSNNLELMSIEMMESLSL